MSVAQYNWGDNVLPVFPIATPEVMLRIWAGSPLDKDGCLVWGGHHSDGGYGRIKVNHTYYSVHRITWAWFNQIEIPDRMSVDHLCYQTLCCNPVHLDICTVGENSRRSPRTMPSLHRAKTHCPQGHPYYGENLIIDNKGHRVCRMCATEAKRRYRKRQTEGGAS